MKTKIFNRNLFKSLVQLQFHHQAIDPFNEFETLAGKMVINENETKLLYGNLDSKDGKTITMPMKVLKTYRGTSDRDVHIDICAKSLLNTKGKPIVYELHLDLEKEKWFGISSSRLWFIHPVLYMKLMMKKITSLKHLSFNLDLPW